MYSSRRYIQSAVRPTNLSGGWTLKIAAVGTPTALLNPYTMTSNPQVLSPLSFMGLKGYRTCALTKMVGTLMSDIRVTDYVMQYFVNLTPGPAHQSVTSICPSLAVTAVDRRASGPS